MTRHRNIIFRVLLPILLVFQPAFGCSSTDGSTYQSGDGGDADMPLDGTIGDEILDSTVTDRGNKDRNYEKDVGEQGDPCSSVDLCAEGLVCIDGFCIADKGACDTDSDCSGDTYCCGDECLDSDSEKGICIAYGEGPRGNLNEECVGVTTVGLFEPDVQCEWTNPPQGDPYPDHVNVLTTPLVVDLPNDSGDAAEIVIISYNYSDGGDEAAIGNNSNYFGVIRILNGQDCSQHETIDDTDNRMIAASTPAIGDLDGDGQPEIVVHRAEGGVLAFHWDQEDQRYERYWVALDTDLNGVERWDGPAIHDLDDDGMPEVISASEVYDGTSGARLNPGQRIIGDFWAGQIPIVGDLDLDGEVELVAGAIYRWNRTDQIWEVAYPGISQGYHWAFADFGTPGETVDSFDSRVLDGVAEIVATGDGRVALGTLDGQVLFNVNIDRNGGPPTIGDFDNDGFPEIASAGGTAYRVFDLDCRDGAATPGCESSYVRWSQVSQDSSSAMTGSSVFDFEGDGKAEAIYADECFTRIYDGMTGEVLYSAFRTSCTWYENAVVADVDQDSNTEILVNSNSNCNIQCPPNSTEAYVDPIHRGIRCDSSDGCPSGNCSEGFCRCEDDSQCEEGFSCEPPLEGTLGEGNTCRTEHPPGIGLAGLRVLRDRLDRWASSRPIWNQHPYSVTNIDDNLGIPSTSTWQQNFTDLNLNNFRQNVQGETGSEDFPDITGNVDEESVCQREDEETRLVATVCNRGKKAVGASMPATFYLGDPQDGEVLCVSYTQGPVPVGGCLEVSCSIEQDVTGTITIFVNDNGEGERTTVECNEDNNTDTVEISDCILI